MFHHKHVSVPQPIFTDILYTRWIIFVSITYVNILVTILLIWHRFALLILPPLKSPSPISLNNKRWSCAQTDGQWKRFIQHHTKDIENVSITVYSQQIAYDLGVLGPFLKLVVSCFVSRESLEAP